MFEVFYRYLHCTLIGRMSSIRICIGHLGFFVHCCGVLSHTFRCIGRQKVYVHWCGCYIRFLQLSCMVVMILVVIWASCDWITSHVLNILLFGPSSYNLVHVHFHDSVRSDCSLSNSISRSVLLFQLWFFWGAVMTPSLVLVWALLPDIIKGECWNILYSLEGNNVFVLCRKLSTILCKKSNTFNP